MLIKAGSRKIIHIYHVERTLHYSRYMHYYFQSGELISLILPINCDVETQLSSNEKFGNRSSENVPLNLNLLVSIFLSLLVSFSFQYLVFGFYFYSIMVFFLKKFSLLHPLSFPLQCILFRSSFPFPLFIDSAPICFTTFYQERQTKINTTSISNVFVPCASHFFIRSFYNREPPQEWERHKNHKIRLATLPVYHAFQ